MRKRSVWNSQFVILCDIAVVSAAVTSTAGHSDVDVRYVARLISRRTLQCLICPSGRANRRGFIEPTSAAAAKTNIQRRLHDHLRDVQREPCTDYRLCESHVHISTLHTRVPMLSRNFTSWTSKTRQSESADYDPVIINAKCYKFVIELRCS